MAGPCERPSSRPRWLWALKLCASLHVHVYVNTCDPPPPCRPHRPPPPPPPTRMLVAWRPTHPRPACIQCLPGACAEFDRQADERRQRGWEPFTPTHPHATHAPTSPCDMWWCRMRWRPAADSTQQHPWLHLVVDVGIGAEVVRIVGRLGRLRRRQRHERRSSITAWTSCGPTTFRPAQGSATLARMWFRRCPGAWPRPPIWVACRGAKPPAAAHQARTRVNQVPPSSYLPIERRQLCVGLCRRHGGGRWARCREDASKDAEAPGTTGRSDPVRYAVGPRES